MAVSRRSSVRSCSFVGGGEERKDLLGFSMRSRGGSGAESRTRRRRCVSVRARNVCAGPIAAVIPNPDDIALRALYRMARVVAMPSLAEGYGLVAIEAQACGAAVIAAIRIGLAGSRRRRGVLRPSRAM